MNSLQQLLYSWCPSLIVIHFILFFTWCIFLWMYVLLHILLLRWQRQTAVTQWRSSATQRVLKKMSFCCRCVKLSLPSSYTMETCTTSGKNDLKVDWTILLSGHSLCQFQVLQFTQCLLNMCMINLVRRGAVLGMHILIFLIGSVPCLFTDLGTRTVA